jgi:hypothetical protein
LKGIINLYEIHTEIKILKSSESYISKDNPDTYTIVSSTLFSNSNFKFAGDLETKTKARFTEPIP